MTQFIAETGGTVCAPVENGFAICNSIEFVAISLLVLDIIILVDLVPFVCDA